MRTLPATPLDDLTEKAWQTQVREMAAVLGYWVYHPLKSKGSQPGWPDLTLLGRGREVKVELKTMRGKLSPAQKDVIRRLLDVDSEVYVARPDDWDDLGVILARTKGRETAAGYQAAERLAAATRAEVEG